MPELTTRPEPLQQNICAVVVTYHPDEGLLSRLKSLLPHAGKIVLIDNASNEQARKNITQICSDEPKIKALFNDFNRGVAGALNQGMAWAEVNGFAWVICFDQDSVVLPNFGPVLLGTYRDYAKSKGNLIHSVAIIGANYQEKILNSSLLNNLQTSHQSWLEWPSPVTSGSLFSMKAFKEIGLFCNEYFIDYVDTEYCYRAWCMNFQVLLSTQPSMIHSIGLPKRRRFLWRTVNIGQYPPRRWYTIGRNFADLFKRFLWQKPSWCLAELNVLVRSAIKLFLFEELRWKKIAALLRGVFHGLRGDFSSNPYYHQNP